MCVSKGAPDKPKDRQLQEFWDMLRRHNAVFYGDGGLQDAIEEYLTLHGIRRPGISDQQREYILHLMEKVKAQPEVAAV